MEDCGYTGDSLVGRRKCPCLTCKEKEAAWQKAYREANKEKISTWNKAYYAENKDSHKEEKATRGRAYYRADPVVYAFPAVLTNGDGPEIHAVKVGKSGNWARRKGTYERDGVSRKSRYTLVPDWPSGALVSVHGVAEAEIAEALVQMVLQRVKHLPVPPGLREYYLGLDMDTAQDLIQRAADAADACVAQFLKDIA